MVSKYNIVGSIVLYNADVKKLENVITSFLNSDIKKLKLCLVDNSPKKLPSIARILKKYPSIDYVFNDENIGYGAAHNIAIRKYENDSKYHVILNPDIFFGNHVLKTIHNRMDRDSTIGLSSTKILFEDGRVQSAHKKLPSPLIVGVRLLGKKIPLMGSVIMKLFISKLNEYECKHLMKENSFLCPAISGCFMFFRSSALKKLKGFDERFFMYFEDVDLSRRCFEKYKNIVFNDINIHHFWERGSYKSFKLFKYHIQSAIKYFNKFGWVFDKKRSKFNHFIDK
ncbi:MAG: glycosyltransferase [Alphaproteobacteria bacterium]|nr:glycosyltransferase [Alphaproteobacteria bacterium]